MDERAGTLLEPESPAEEVSPYGRLVVRTSTPLPEEAADGQATSPCKTSTSKLAVPPRPCRKRPLMGKPPPPVRPEHPRPLPPFTPTARTGGGIVPSAASGPPRSNRRFSCPHLPPTHAEPSQARGPPRAPVSVRREGRREPEPPAPANVFAALPTRTGPSSPGRRCRRRRTSTRGATSCPTS